jgi:hypothetical protein
MDEEVVEDEEDFFSASSTEEAQSPKRYASPAGRQP